MPGFKRLAWRDDYLCYFPGGQNDPNLSVLKFTTARPRREKKNLRCNARDHHQQITGKSDMEKYDVTVVEYPATRLIGLKVQTTMKKAQVDCAAIWPAFGPRMPELLKGDCRNAYGVSVMLSAEDFEYWAAVEVDKSAAVPEGMGSLDIPAGLYAKTTVPNLEKLMEAFMFLYEGWPKNQKDYTFSETAPCFELYPPTWWGDGVFEVYMPVRKL